MDFNPPKLRHLSVLSPKGAKKPTILRSGHISNIVTNTHSFNQLVTHSKKHLK
jgi:hypothetical protein